MKTFKEMVITGHPLTEEVNIDQIIKDLVDTPASDKNEDQGKFISLLKGIAFSDDPKSDVFMKKLMTSVDDSYLPKA